MMTPDFRSSPAPKPQRDYLTEKGAEELAEIIRSAWAKCGHSPRVWVEHCLQMLGERSGGAIFQVRSDLVSGVPTRATTALVAHEAAHPWLSDI